MELERPYIQSVKILIYFFLEKEMTFNFLKKQSVPHMSDVKRQECSGLSLQNLFGENWW